MRRAHGRHAFVWVDSAARAWYCSGMDDGGDPAPGPEPERPMQTAIPAAIDAEVATDNAKKGSVVGVAYKTRYATRASEGGIARKAAQRSAWDWLAQTIAGECL